MRRASYNERRCETDGQHDQELAGTGAGPKDAFFGFVAVRSRNVASALLTTV